MDGSFDRRRVRARVAGALLGLSLLGGCGPASPAAPAVSWDQVISEIQAQYPDVTGGTFQDGELNIRVQGDWTDLGATRLACETVKPILRSHGVGGQQFAIFDRTGSVIATGSRCP